MSLKPVLVDATARFRDGATRLVVAFGDADPGPRRSYGAERRRRGSTAGRIEDRLVTLRGNDVQSAAARLGPAERKPAASADPSGQEHAGHRRVDLTKRQAGGVRARPARRRYRQGRARPGERQERALARP